MRVREIAALFGAMTVAGTCVAQEPPGSKRTTETVEVTTGDYVAIAAGRVFPERSIGTTGQGLSLSAMYGAPLKGRFGYEINVNGSVLETGPGSGTDFYSSALNADLIFNLTSSRGVAFTPFLLLGVGAGYDDRFPNDRDGVAFRPDAGLGFVTRPLFSGRFLLRGEARYVYDAKEGGHGEPRVSLGIEIPLGRVERRVEYVRIETETLREVVREVQRPWVDSDGDGVDDDHDRCPDTPRGLRVDAVGCAIVNQQIELRGVTFEFNQSRLTPNARTVLSSVARAFTGQPTLHVEIAGHTDSIGSDEANLRLSQRRADAVRVYLIENGAMEKQLDARGYGESQLLVSPERSDEDRERNRRVEFRVIEGK